MTIHGIVSRHADFIRARKHGLWRSLEWKPTKEQLFRDIASMVGLSERGSDYTKARRLNGTNPWSLFMGLLGDVRNVDSTGSWILYWALSEAMHEVLLFMRQGMHEPALTAALLANIRCALRMSGGITGGEVAALHGADHQALWNEKESGADFGLVVETVRGGFPRYLTVLVQVKRARRRRIQVDLAQAGKIAASHIGAYLFFNEFEPVHDGFVLATVKPASMVSGEMTRARSVDVITDASDFALSVAFGLPSRSSPLGMEFDSSEKAIQALFDVELELQLNHILVTVVGERSMTVDRIIAHEREWQTLIQRAMTNRRDGRPLFHDGSQSGLGR